LTPPRGRGICRALQLSCRGRSPPGQRVRYRSAASRSSSIASGEAHALHRVGEPAADLRLRVGPGHAGAPAAAARARRSISRIRSSSLHCSPGRSGSSAASSSATTRARSAGASLRASSSRRSAAGKLCANSTRIVGSSTTLPRIPAWQRCRSVGDSSTAGGARVRLRGRRCRSRGCATRDVLVVDRVARGPDVVVVPVDRPSSDRRRATAPSDARRRDAATNHAAVAGSAFSGASPRRDLAAASRGWRREISAAGERRLHGDGPRVCMFSAWWRRSTPKLACFTTCSEVVRTSVVGEVTLYLAVPSPSSSGPLSSGPSASPSLVLRRARSASSAGLVLRHPPGSFCVIRRHAWKSRSASRKLLKDLHSSEPEIDRLVGGVAVVHRLGRQRGGTRSLSNAAG